MTVPEKKKAAKSAVRFALDNGAVDLPVLNKTALKLRKTPSRRMAELDLKENIRRIQDECDPISFLASVVNGVPIPVIEVTGRDENGTPVLEVSYVNASVSDRISVARELLKKYMPNWSGATRMPEEEDDPDDPKGKKPHPSGHFGQILEAAAHNLKAEYPEPDEEVREAKDPEWTPPGDGRRNYHIDKRGPVNPDPKPEHGMTQEELDELSTEADH